MISFAVEDSNAYDKMKKELYKTELSKQIEEKRQLKEQRKNNEKSEKQFQRDAEENSQVPYYLRNPFMKQNTESWTSKRNFVFIEMVF